GVGRRWSPDARKRPASRGRSKGAGRDACGRTADGPGGSSVRPPDRLGAERSGKPGSADPSSAHACRPASGREQAWLPNPNRQRGEEVLVRPSNSLGFGPFALLQCSIWARSCQPRRAGVEKTGPVRDNNAVSSEPTDKVTR